VPPAARRIVKRFLAARYRRGSLLRAFIYCLLSVRFMQLANGALAKGRIVLATGVMAVTETLPRLGRPSQRIPVDFAGRRYVLTLGGCNDLDVLREVLLCEEYHVDLPREPEVIVDLGSNIGASLIALHARYPAARLVGVEPDPATFVRLLANTAILANVTLRNVAMASEDGTVSLYPSRDSWESSLFPTQHGRHSITVPALTLRSLLDDVEVTRVGLLKIDIEGAEFDVLTSFDHWNYVDAIVVEWHGDLIARSVEDVTEILRDFDLSVLPHGSTPGRYMITGTRATVLTTL
jgi:FkbM family methyltransferase